MPHLFRKKFLQKSDIFSEYLLKLMAFERTPLVFLFDTHVRLVYSSMVLDADRRDNLTLLDGLQPDLGNDHLVPGSSVTFAGKANGVETGFRARIREGSSSSGGQRVVRLYFPHETYHAQKRGALRVSLPPSTPPVRLTKTNGGQELVRPVNVGRGGMRVLLPEKNEKGELRDLFREGDTVLLESADLDGFRLPPLSGRVVYLEHSGRETGTDLMAMGILFLDFPEEYEEPLQAFVARKDREHLKNLRIDPRG
ncbi:MAG: flagellar brake protein [Nitrospirae bacterium]|nr:flagellar brake protein [Nitrospirota bacterium]MCL5285879.1 flagellar brake protein [Nitrospirota bacterium]